MNETPLEGIRACVFDAYGTLFDYASAAARCSDVLETDWPGLTHCGGRNSFSTVGSVRSKVGTLIFGRSPVMPWISRWRHSD